MQVEIYPREGTETGRSVRGFRAQRWLKLIPVRGRKPDVIGRHDFLSFWLKFIPARGRKLPEIGHRKGRGLVEIYPREGTETRSAGLANHIQCHNYPREGTETRDVKTIKSFFPNLNDKFNPKGLYKKGKMC